MTFFLLTLVLAMTIFSILNYSYCKYLSVNHIQLMPCVIHWDIQWWAIAILTDEYMVYRKCIVILK